MAGRNVITHRNDIEAAAADWLSRRDAGWTASDEQAFDVWLNADARHQTAWRELEAAWTEFDRPRSDGHADAMIRELDARRRRRRLRAIAGLAGGVAMAACVAGVLFYRPAAVSASAPAVAATGVLSRPERRVLPDGSVVELNKGAELIEEYSVGRRGVRLVRGEAHFAVVKDAARPFVVVAGGVEVRAVGTAFAVKLNPQAINVVVTEGRVAVEGPPVSAVASEPVMVGKGAWVSVPTTPTAAEPPRARAVAADEIDRMLAWRAAKLELSGTPLSEAVALLNQASPVHIRIADAELGQMRLSGVFRADNAEGFARILELHYGAAVERGAAGELVLKRAR